MSANKRQPKDKSMQKSGRHLVESQELDDNVSKNDNKNLPQNVINSQSIGIKKTTDQTLNSQSSVGSVEEWNGSQVINFKRFKKFSKNAIKSEPKVIRLKKIPNNSYQEWLKSQTTDENKDNTGVLETEKSNKRKSNSEVDPVIDSVTPKKSRH